MSAPRMADQPCKHVPWAERRSPYGAFVLLGSELENSKIHSPGSGRWWEDFRPSHVTWTKEISDATDRVQALQEATKAIDGSDFSGNFSDKAFTEVIWPFVLESMPVAQHPEKVKKVMKKVIEKVTSTISEALDLEIGQIALGAAHRVMAAAEANGGPGTCYICGPRCVCDFVSNWDKLSKLLDGYEGYDAVCLPPVKLLEFHTWALEVMEAMPIDYRGVEICSVPFEFEWVREMRFRVLNG